MGGWPVTTWRVRLCNNHETFECKRARAGQEDTSLEAVAARAGTLVEIEGLEIGRRISPKLALEFEKALWAAGIQIPVLRSPTQDLMLVAQNHIETAINLPAAYRTSPGGVWAVPLRGRIDYYLTLEAVR